MSDLIERQKAIEAIEEMQKPIMRSNFSHEQFIFRGMSEARQAIIDLPFAQPEKGKWIYNSPVTMKCDQCGLVIKDWDWHRFKYCPNCISDMRGEQE